MEAGRANKRSQNTQKCTVCEHLLGVTLIHNDEEGAECERNFKNSHEFQREKLGVSHQISYQSEKKGGTPSRPLHMLSKYNC